MAISIVGTPTSYNSGSTTSSTHDISVPSGVASGDVMIAHLHINSDSTTINTLPSGWALFSSTAGSVSNATNARRSEVFYKVSAGGEPASYQWGTSANRLAAGGMVALRGVDTADILSAGAGQANTTASTSCQSPDITPTDNDCLLLMITAAVGNVSTTQDGAMSEQWDTNTTSGSGNCNSSLGTQQLSGGSGVATGTRTSTLSASNRSIAHLLAIAPSAVAAGQTTLQRGFWGA